LRAISALWKDIMDRKRVLELAIAELERQRAGIDEEIAAVQAELRGTGSAVRQAVSIPSTGTRGRRQRTPAERKAQAQRMREYWAAKRTKRTQAAKAAPTAKKAAGVSAKVRAKTEAQKKALSVAMKKAWAKRKAAGAAKRAKS
jgi:hypothetical protein